MRPLRIAFALHGYPPECVGGTERVAQTLARGLVQRGHDVHVLCGSLVLGSPRTPTHDRHEGIAVTRLHRNDLYFDDWDKGWHPGVSAAFGQELQRLAPDLLHVHHWIRMSRDLVRVGAELGIPVVAHLHDHAASCPRVFRIDRDNRFCTAPQPDAPCATCAPRRPFQGDREIALGLDWYRRDFRDELRSAALVLAPSRFHGDAVLRYLDVADVRVEALANPAVDVLEPARAAQPLPAAGGAPRAAGTLRVAHWGNLYDLKGVHVLLRAVRRSGRADRIRVELLGEAPFAEYGAQLRREAAGLQVEFRGAFARADLANLVADVVVLPTLCEESYGLVLDEAFMLKLPVLASEAGAFRERAGGGAAFFPKGDEAALAALLVRALDDGAFLPDLRARIPRAWSTADQCVERLLGLYGEVVRGERRAPQPATPAGAAARLAQRLEFEWTRSELRFAGLLRNSAALPPTDATLPQ